MAISPKLLDTFNSFGKEITTEEEELLSLLLNLGLEVTLNLYPAADFNKKYGSATNTFFRDLNDPRALFVLTFRRGGDGIEFYQLPRSISDGQISNDDTIKYPHNGFWVSMIKDESGYAYRINFVDGENVVQVQNLPISKDYYGVAVYSKTANDEDSIGLEPDKKYSCHLEKDDTSDCYLLKDESDSINTLTVIPKNIVEGNKLYLMHHIGSQISRIYCSNYVQQSQGGPLL